VSHRSRRIRCATFGHCALAFALFWSSAALAAGPAWKPERGVEFIIPAGPGGGQDRTARVIQKILQDSGAVSVPITIVNRGGGGGNIAYGYLQQFKGDGHYVATASPTLITNHILGTSPTAYTDVTPLAVLYSEYVGYAVNAEGPIKTGADLMARLRKDPESVIFAFGTSRGNANHIAVAQLAKAAGADPKRLKVVIYKSSIDATTALMGGHVSVVATPTSTYVPVLDSGKIRLVGVAAPARQGGVFAQVPTWKEQGHDVVMPTFRMLIGPGGMTPAQVAYWDHTFARLSQNAEWQKELERNDWDNSFLDSGKARAFLDAQARAYRAALSELGLVKPAQ
jgi:putative tricarboxylic transport membrane protein